MERARELLMLSVEEQRLIAEEKWILETLEKIKSQMMSLKVEQLQLTSMLREYQQKANEKDDGAQTAAKTPAEKTIPVDVRQLDAVESSMNTKILDLTVMNELDTILTGNFYAESDESDDEPISKNKSFD